MTCEKGEERGKSGFEVSGSSEKMEVTLAEIIKRRNMLRGKSG